MRYHEKFSVKEIAATIRAFLTSYPELHATAITGLSDNEVTVYIDRERYTNWDDEFRNLLNKFCTKFSELGLIWRYEYPSMNHLTINNKEDGEPWMLWNHRGELELKLAENI